MANRSIPVEIYTASHRILGRVHPTASGLFSFLNIPTSSYLELEGAMLMRLHQPGKLVARYPNFWVVKGEIVAALLSNRSQLGPTGFTRGGYSTTVPHWVRVVMGGYELMGVIEAPGKFNFPGLMFEGERFFVPIYNARLPAFRSRGIWMLLYLLCGAWVSGLLLGRLIPADTLRWLLLAALALAAFLIFRGVPSYRLAFLSLLALMLGGARFQANLPVIDQDHLAYYNDIEHRSQITGGIIEDPVHHDENVELVIAAERIWIPDLE